MLKSLQAIESYREREELPAKAFPWLKYIVQAEQTIVNLERVESLRELDEQNPVLDYVERSLRLLDSLPLSYWIKELAEDTGLVGDGKRRNFPPAPDVAAGRH